MPRDPADRAFAGTYTRMVLDFVERRAGVDAVDRVVRQAGIGLGAEELRDESTWCSHRQFASLARAAGEVVGGHDELVHLYAETELVTEGGSSAAELVALVHALGSPTRLVETMGESNHFGSLEIASEALGDAAYRVRFRVLPGIEPDAAVCAFLRGVVPLGVRVFGFNDIDVREVACQCRGDEWCCVEVAWDDTRDVEFLLEEAIVHRRVADRRLETFQATIADIVSADDLDVVLERIVTAAGRATTSSTHILEIDGLGGNRRYYTLGATVEAAREIAARLDDGDPAYVAVDVASTRRYGRLIVVDHSGGAQFERPALESYARLAATALDSAFALEDARREARTSAAFLGLAASLAELASDAEVASRVVDAMPAVLDCDGAAFLLRRDGKLHVAAQRGFDAKELGTIEFAAVDDIEHRLREVCVRTVHSMTDESWSAMQSHGYEAVATAPIVIDDVVRGLLVAGVHDVPERLSDMPNFRERFVGLASQASIALRNAWLVDQMRHQSLHDPLTGLPNRALIMDRAEQMLARASRRGDPCAVLFVDLDGFKEINDTRGHDAGDRLLCCVAERLRAAVRDSDTVGRLGGDEFVVLVDGGSLDAGVEIVAERLLEVLGEPFDGEVGGVPVDVRASIGIAMGGDHRACDLLREADVALYRAKSAGKSCYRIFTPEVDGPARRPGALTGSLVAAAANDEFRLEYQPIFSLHDARPTGFEALVRWDHPELGMLAPVAFVPQLEGSGLIVEVGRWILREACRQAASWHADGAPVDMSVNVSARQLERPAFVDEVRNALREAALSPSSLVIEITETAIVNDPVATGSLLQGLKELGVRIAIDDFGTGYSSLASLGQFQADVLKIDRSFVAAMSESRASAELVRALVGLGEALGIETVAEGIERPDQLARLREMGCERGQGFLLARPLSAAAAAAFLFPRDVQTLRR
jgi:diguanylate cyclase (GGDEF)-like protein